MTKTQNKNKPEPAFDESSKYCFWLRIKREQQNPEITKYETVSNQREVEGGGGKIGNLWNKKAQINSVGDREMR